MMSNINNRKIMDKMTLMAHFKGIKKEENVKYFNIFILAYFLQSYNYYMTNISFKHLLLQIIVIWYLLLLFLQKFFGISFLIYLC